MNNNENNNENNILLQKELISEDKEQVNKFKYKIPLLKDNNKLETIFLISFSILILYDILSIKKTYFNINNKNSNSNNIINKIKQKGGVAIAGLVNAYSTYSMMKGPQDPNKKKLINQIKYLGYVLCFFGFIIAAGLPLTIMGMLIIITMKYAKKQFIDLITTLK